MLLENLIACFTLVTELFFFSRLCESAVNSRNTITVNEPEKGAIWILEQTSYPIIWTQSKFCFKWNIELLDNEENKVVEISSGLSEFSEGTMRHVWLIPHTVPSGDYRVRICEHSAPEICGNSDLFSIRSSEGKKTYSNQVIKDSFQQPLPHAQLWHCLHFSVNVLVFAYMKYFVHMLYAA